MDDDDDAAGLMNRIVLKDRCHFLTTEQLTATATTAKEARMHGQFGIRTANPSVMKRIKPDSIHMIGLTSHLRDGWIRCEVLVNTTEAIEEDNVQAVERVIVDLTEETYNALYLWDHGDVFDGDGNLVDKDVGIPSPPPRPEPKPRGKRSR